MMLCKARSQSYVLVTLHGMPEKFVEQCNDLIRYLLALLALEGSLVKSLLQQECPQSFLSWSMHLESYMYDAMQDPQPILHALVTPRGTPEKSVEQCNSLIRYLLSLLGTEGLFEKGPLECSCLQAAAKDNNSNLATALLDPENSSEEAVLELVRLRDFRDRTVLHFCARSAQVGLARQVRFP
jgi:hypothetical protein